MHGSHFLSMSAPIDQYTFGVWGVQKSTGIGFEQKRRSSLCFSYSQDGITIQIQPQHLIYSYNDGYTSSLYTAAPPCSRCTAAEASTSS